MPQQNGVARRRAAAANNGQTLQQQQPSFQSKPWFLGAPITKILCICWAAGSLWAINNDTADTENRYDHGENLWVAAILNSPSNWVFHTPMEMFTGLSFLAHYLRRLEQELSSRRLVAWLLVSEAIYVLVRLMVVATIGEESAEDFVTSKNSASGPYLFVGGVLYWYKAYVPRLYPRFLSSTTLGISCSEKTFPYLWALYVLSMRGTASLLIGVIGAFTSATYFFLLSVSTKNIDGNTINLPLLDIPDAVVNMLPWEALGGLFLLDSNPKVYAPFITRATMIPRGDGRPRRQPGRGGPPVARRVRPAVAEETPIAVAMPVPSPEAVAQLVAMGFPEVRVVEALQASENNVERAANILLTSS